MFIKLTISIVLLATTFCVASDEEAPFMGYQELTTKLKAEYVKSGMYASTEQVKKALKSEDWVVVDVRNSNEWSAAYIEGTKRVGRKNPEKLIKNFCLDFADDFTRNKVIVVCNSAARASIVAETFKTMGFKKVMIYDIYAWIDECNPISNDYTIMSSSKGTGLKFGTFKAAHCKK
ncbi:rhodanese-like domain-containing protein [Sulfurovum sp.]|uniref:rhodanese-like domain-containing protein n=1 Tax=Sulfurovum sp. TaxID=1969726 RepID=UPI002867E305|nr:rhodanese-like domain-containing protein [Sulfurovum sp.]